MTPQEIDLVLDNYIDKSLNRPRSKAVQLLNLLNNFWFGFALGCFFWVLPFLELAQIIGDAIALNCGAK